MKTRILVFTIVASIVLAWSACNRDHTVNADKSASNLEYLFFMDHGCRGQEVLGKANSSGPYLAKHRISGDTLILTIHHEANCCPAFVDSIIIHENMVDICIDDTLRGCKCMCEYENDFTFLNPGTGTLRVRFGWMGSPFELDTLIQVP